MISRKKSILKCIFISLTVLSSVSVFGYYPNYSDYKDELLSTQKDCSHENSNSTKETNFLNAFWVPDSGNKCGGFFRGANKSFINSFNDNNVHFKANDKSLISQSSMSYLSGAVKLGYKGMQLDADKVCYIPDVLNKGDLAIASGGIHFTQKQLLVTADHGLWYVSGGNYLKDAMYLMKVDNLGVGSAWGRAAEVWSESPTTTSMNKASMSFCSFKDPDWDIEADNINLDTKRKQGFAYNVWLNLFGQKVFYLPFIGFPLTDKRQTGLLYPVFGYNTNSGYYLSLPYYWNLAPNYDLTTALNIYSSRGPGVTASTRFISRNLKANLMFFHVFNDSEFGRFKESTSASYANSTNQDDILLAQDLLSYSKNRIFYKGAASYQPSDNIAIKTEYSWMSDDYMRIDFPTVKSNLPSQRLPRKITADLEYGDLYAKFLFQDSRLIQALTQDVIQGVFSAKPDIDIAYHNISNYFSNLETRVNLNFLNFAPTSGSLLSSTNDNFNLSGIRSYITPVLTFYNFDPWIGGRAQLGLSGRYYDWKNSSDDETYQSSDINTWFDLEKKLPISYHSSDGLFLVQPRFFYKYIPYKDQDNLPVVDASLPVDSYQQLFRVNRFLGNDRIGDDNSITFSLENSWFNKDGSLRAKFDVGTNYAFDYHKVCLSNDCEEDVQAHQHFSPWQFRSIYLTDSFKYSFILALDHDLDGSSSFYGDIVHSFDGGHAKVYYNYASYLGLYPMVLKNAKLVGFELSQDFNMLWSVLSNIQFNLTDSTTYGYFAGIKYKSCCLDLSLGLERRYIGEESNGEKEYQNDYVFKFSLTGLGV